MDKLRVLRVSVFFYETGKKSAIRSSVFASSGNAAIDAIFQFLKKIAKPRFIVLVIFPALELVQAQLQVLGELLTDEQADILGK